MSGSHPESEAGFGDKPSPGDLDDAVQHILSGEATVDDVALTAPGMFRRYGRALRRVQTIALRRMWRAWMTEGLWIVGEPGEGRSHRAFRDFRPDTHYVKDPSDEWWDGYVGQPVVLINDFRGQIKFSELMDLVDKWPKTVRIRRREPVPFLAKTVVVTSVFTPEEVYRGREDQWEQFDRRFKVERLGRPTDASAPTGLA